MKRACDVKPAGQWDAARAVDFVTLDVHERHRRRIVLTGERGTTFMLDLPQATALRDGDGLVLDDGAIVRVAGRPEPLVEITAASGHELARLAWHIGNRHIDVEIAGDKLRIRSDHDHRGHAARARAPGSRRSRRRSIRSKAPMRRGRGMGMATSRITRTTGIIPTSMSMTKALLRSTPRKRGAKTIPPREAEADENNHAALYRLMAWLSPAYPIGAFSYSSGIEWAVEAGDIKDAETLRQWLAVMMADGSGFADAVFFVARASCDRRRATMPRFAPSSSLPRRLSPRKSAFWKRRRRAAPFSR